MKKIILLVLALFLVPAIYGSLEPSCFGVFGLGQNCTFTTANTGCLPFSVYNESGDLFQSGNLVNYSVDENILYFNLTTQSTAQDYTVFLCDNSTKIISAGGTSEMDSLAYILFPFLVSGLLFVLAFSLDKERHELARLIIGLFGLLAPLGAFMFAFIFNVDFIGSSNIESALTTQLWIFLIFVFVIFLYIFGYIIFSSLRSANENREQKLQY